VLADFMMYWLAPHVPWRRLLEIPRHPSFLGGCRLDFGGALSPVNLLLGTIGVDVVLLMAGISPNVMLWLGPFNIFHSAFVHANLNWTLGPFKYLIATPVFHAGITPRRLRAATAISPAHFRSGTSCSGPSGSRKAGCPTITASMSSRRSRPRLPGNCLPVPQIGRSGAFRVGCIAMLSFNVALTYV